MLRRIIALALVVLCVGLLVFAFLRFGPFHKSSNNTAKQQPISQDSGTKSPATTKTKNGSGSSQAATSKTTTGNTPADESTQSNTSDAQAASTSGGSSSQLANTGPGTVLGIFVIALTGGAFAAHAWQQTGRRRYR